VRINFKDRCLTSRPCWKKIQKEPGPLELQASVASSYCSIVSKFTHAYDEVYLNKTVSKLSIGIYDYLIIHLMQMIKSHTYHNFSRYLKVGFIALWSISEFFRLSRSTKKNRSLIIKNRFVDHFCFIVYSRM